MGKFRKKVIILIYGIVIAGLSLIPFIDIKRPFSKQNTIAMYIEDNNGNYQLSSSKEFPKEGYILNLEKSSCKNGGILSQDVNTKEINLIISKNDACNLYFEKEKLPLLETIMNKRNDDTITVYTEGMIGEMYTFNHEEATQTTGWSEIERRDYRYIGATPYNWVKFNREDWRIIGVFTVENSSGTKEQLIKIIRNENIGSIKWNSRVNDWSTSSLKTLLNTGDYYKRTNTYASTGLNDTAKSQIEEVKWYLGGSSEFKNLGAPDYYNFERGTTVAGNNIAESDKVGLMYPSDYVYTYANGVDSTCYSNGYNCNASATGSPNNSWLFTKFAEWTISPFTNNYYGVFI